MEHSSVTGISEQEILTGKTGIISEFKHHILKHVPFFYLEMLPV